VTRLRFQQRLLDHRVIARTVALLVFVTCAVCGLNAQVADPDAKERHDAIKSLTNADIEWEGFGFGDAGPGVTGANAKQVEELGVAAAKDLIEIVEKEDSFVAAHVLLARAWRIPRKDNDWITLPISTGFVVSYYGLLVKIEWKDVSGRATKTVTIPKMDLQRKRIAYWWKARYRDFPEEFSPDTVVE